MTLDQIRQYINYICVKENSGGTLTPQQVNVIFPAVSIDMYNKTIEKAQLYALQNQVPFSRAIYEFKSMLKFRTKKNIGPVVTFNASVASTPANYIYVTQSLFDLIPIGTYLSNVDFPVGTYVSNKSTAGGNHILILNNNVNNIVPDPTTKTVTFTDYNSAIYNFDVLGNYGYWLSLITILNGNTKSIDILTDQELDDRRTNTLSVPLDEYPAAIINNNLINIYPNNITSAEFTYLRKPLTPVYDYYIDANANEVYLAAGTFHTLTTDETGSAGQTSGTVTSLTVELDWDELFHVVFCNEVLSRVGINLKDGMVEQYINQAKQEQG
jgi:hypothetical protein